jgi:hypothetical protein
MGILLKDATYVNWETLDFSQRYPGGRGEGKESTLPEQRGPEKNRLRIPFVRHFMQNLGHTK